MRAAWRRWIAVPIVGVACGLLGCATAREGEETRSMPTVPGREKVYTPTGPGQQLEQVIDPEFHMAAARRDYEAGLRGASAREIEKLAAFVGYEADHAAGVRRRALQDAREELNALARAVGRGEVESVAELDRAFAHARAALVR